MYAVNAATGVLSWWFPTGAPVQTVPAALGDIVYVTSGTKLFFLDRLGMANGDQGVPDAGGHTGDELLEVDAGTAISASPVVVDPFVYVNAGGDLWAFNRTFGGAPVWTQLTAYGSAGTPAVSRSSVFARRSDGRVYSYNRMTGEIAWVRAGLPAPANGADMAVANGRVYASASNGTTFDLVTLDANDGSVVDRNTTSPRAALGAPVAAGDEVFVAEGSQLLAYRGQPDLAVFADDLVLHTGAVTAGAAQGNLSVTVRNNGDEPASNVHVTVYDGATSIASLTFGTPKPIKAGGRAQGFTPELAWSVGRHVVKVVVARALTETDTSNNEITAILNVVAGPPPDPKVIGPPATALALLLGLLIGVGVMYLPIRRLRELRKAEEPPKAP